LWGPTAPEARALIPNILALGSSSHEQGRNHQTFIQEEATIPSPLLFHPSSPLYYHLPLSIWQLVATILMILLRINCQHFVQFSVQLWDVVIMKPVVLNDNKTL